MPISHAFLQILVLPLDDRLRAQARHVLLELDVHLLATSACRRPARAPTSNGSVVDSIEDCSWKNCAPVAVFTTGVISPTFIFAIIFSSSSFISSREIGPMSPPLAFDGASDTSAATFSNGSPLTMRARIAVGLLARLVERADARRPS